MDKSQIKQALIDKLSGSNWDRVKDSVIGKELLAFGTEVISECTDVQDSLINAFDYRNTDRRGLISMSHVQEIGLTFQRPSYVKVQLNTARVVRPFGLKLAIGNIVFYNKETVDTRFEVVLYQASLNYMYRTTSNFYPLPYDVRVKPNTVVIPRDSVTNDTLFNLGQAMPDSVLIYSLESGVVKTLDKVTPLNQSPTRQLYKPYVLYDGSFAIMTGDDIWGASLKNTTNLAIYWLKPDFSDVTLNVGDALPIRVYLDNSNYTTDQATIVEYYPGSEDDINYARSFYQKEYLQRQSIVSKEQIKEWMNAHVDVLDSSVVAINNDVYVYVKPKFIEGTEAYYEKYMSDLDLYGALFVNYRVLKGTAVETSLEIVTYNTATAEQKELVNTRITSLYSFQNMKFNDSLDTSAVVAILNEYGIQGIVYIHGKEMITTAADGSTKLSFSPIRGSLRFYDAYVNESAPGILIAWDSNGAINGVASTPAQADLSTMLASTKLYGEYFILTSPSTGFLGIYTNADSPYAINFQGEDITAYEVWTSNGFTVVMNVGATDPIIDPFGAIDINAINPDSLAVPPFFTQNKTVGVVDSCNVPHRTSDLIVDGLYFYKAEISSNILTLGVYTGATSEPDYVRSIPNVDSDWIAGSLLYNDDLYIVMNKATYLFRNIKTYIPSSAVELVLLNGAILPSTAIVESLHVFSKQTYALIINDQGVRTLYYGDVIRVSDSGLDFRYETSETLDDIDPTALCHVIRNSNTIIVYKTESTTVDTVTTTTMSVAMIYIDGVLVESTVPMYSQSGTALGSLNYETGEILCSAVNSKTALYRAVYAVPTESSFIKYTGTIVWTEQN